ncbi:MAG: hypothetical protein ABIZ52_07455 [Candidatus Limnocylindrales bacterium]
MITRLATLVLAIVVTGCGVTPGTSPVTSGSAGPAAAFRHGEFGQATVDAAVTLLAESGIATYEAPESASPIREVASPASPARLLLDQVQAMALEAHTGGGIEGAELDALFEVSPDLAPPSYLLAGYVAAVDTPGAHLARSLMGVEDWTAEDWRAAPTVIFPKLVLLLFTSDVARERLIEVAAAPPVDLSWQVVAARGPLPPAGGGRVVQAADGPCSTVLNFVSGALKSIFDALRLGDSSGSSTTIVATIWNFVVNVLEVVVTALVKKFEQYVLDWIGRVAAIVGTVATVISWVQPWTASVQAIDTTEKGISGIIPPEDGTLVARIAVPANWDWPGWAANCARESGRALPNMKPEGTPVVWQALIQNPPGLVAPGTAETKLDAQGAARLPFTTLVDDVQDPYTRVPGAIFVRATFERQSLKEFATYLQQELWKELPSIVVGPLQAFLQAPLDQINQRLGTMITVAASGPGVVIFHTQDATPPPVTPPPPPDDGGIGDFCRRYRAYVEWATALGPDTDITQELAREIATRFEGMYPVAPTELKKWVELVFTIYATFAGIDEPYNIPITGQVTGLQNLPEALMTMHAYCGIPWPAT